MPIRSQLAHTGAIYSLTAIGRRRVNTYSPRSVLKSQMKCRGVEGYPNSGWTIAYPEIASKYGGISKYKSPGAAVYVSEVEFEWREPAGQLSSLVRISDGIAHNSSFVQHVVAPFVRVPMNPGAWALCKE